jgi:hypothetical protein
LFLPRPGSLLPADVFRPSIKKRWKSDRRFPIPKSWGSYESAEAKCTWARVFHHVRRHIRH